MKEKNKKLLGRLIFFAIVLILIYLALKDSWGAILEQIMDTAPTVTILAIGCGLMFNLFDGTAIWVLCKRKNSGFRWKTGVECSFYSTFFRVATFGSGTAVAGMYYVSQYQVPVTESLGFFTVNYTIQRTMIVIGFLITFAAQFSTLEGHFASYHHYMLLGVAIAILVVIVLIAFCTSQKLHELLFQIVDKFLKKQEQREKVEDWKLKAAIVRKESKSLLGDWKSLLMIVLCNMGKLTVWYMIPAVILQAQGKDFFLYFCIAAMVIALANVIPSPGGMGSVEFVFLLLFTPFCGKIKAASSMVLYRFCSYYFPAVPGALVLLKQMTRKRKQTTVNRN